MFPLHKRRTQYRSGVARARGHAATSSKLNVELSQFHADPGTITDLTRREWEGITRRGTAQ